MSWLQLRITTSSDQIEELERALLDAGSLSVTLLDAKDSPIYQEEPDATPIWQQVEVCSLFHDTVLMQPIMQQIQSSHPENSPLSMRVETVQDQDWERAWMDSYHAMRFGHRLWICPTDAPAPEQPDATVIRLDPGLAFGTGTHPTTALCLEWLDGQLLQNKCVIDYGCGSGVLAVAAVLLGAAQVIAVDNDPQALTATSQNRERNGIDPARLQCLSPEQLRASAAPLQADVLLANILAGPLQQLAPELAHLVAPEGKLVLSGLLMDQSESVIGSYDSWFDFEPLAERDNWIRLSAIRRYIP